MREFREQRFLSDHKLRVAVTSFLQLLHTFRSLSTEIIQSSENNRFGRANFGAGRNEPALLSIVTKGALESAAGVGQWRRSSIDYAERARDDAITAAVANIVLDEDRADFSADNRSRRTRLEATSFFAVLANIGKEHPTEWILV